LSEINTRSYFFRNLKFYLNSCNQNLSTLPLEFNISTSDLIKVAIAIFCGGVLGFERQYKSKTAGIRTIILICLGSAIFTLISQRAGQGVNINIVTGIGFIGAGVIFKDNISVNGLTTASVIWISAAIGMADGSGNYLLALVTTIMTITVLILLQLLEEYIERLHYEKLYIIIFNNADQNNLILLENTIESHHLRSFTKQVNKRDNNLQVAIQVSGRKKHIDRLDRILLKLPEVRSF
jgi:putative Mg2+ transporter-C (MgtC) family protein